MKSERGKEILWQLVDLSDVLVENFQARRDGTARLRLRGRESPTPGDGLLLDLRILAIPGRRKIVPATT
jgi:hypothetical protein